MQAHMRIKWPLKLVNCFAPTCGDLRWSHGDIPGQTKIGCAQEEGGNCNVGGTVFRGEGVMGLIISQIPYFCQILHFFIHIKNKDSSFLYTPIPHIPDSLLNFISQITDFSPLNPRPLIFHPFRVLWVKTWRTYDNYCHAHDFILTRSPYYYHYYYYYHDH